jgi:hypothetical protein
MRTWVSLFRTTAKFLLVFIFSNLFVRFNTENYGCPKIRNRVSYSQQYNHLSLLYVKKIFKIRTPNFTFSDVKLGVDFATN